MDISIKPVAKNMRISRQLRVYVTYWRSNTDLGHQNVTNTKKISPLHLIKKKRITSPKTSKTSPQKEI